MGPEIIAEAPDMYCTSLARFLLVPIVFIHILCSVLYYGHFTCSKIQKKKIKEMLVGMLQADT